MNTDEPEWLLREIVVTIHNYQLAEHGGAPGLRDESLLLSALGRPKQAFAYSNGDVPLTALAAAYAFGIARNHPFVDGNKRTALAASFAFLRLNGVTVTAPAEERYFVFMRLAAGDLDEQALSNWFADNTG
jgi:death-on-curing protein